MINVVNGNCIYLMEERIIIQNTFYDNNYNINSTQIAILFNPLLGVYDT